MSIDNVIPLGNRYTLNHTRAQKLQDAFKARGRRQPEVFANLSRSVERLIAETKEQFGEKSGAMQKAFGANLVRQKGRYCAKDGIPPTSICKTPGNWIRVLKGFANVLGRDEQLLISEVLEDATATPRPSLGFGQNAWLVELDELIAPMVERLAFEADLPAITDDIARWGLFLKEGKLGVSEWPSDQGIQPAGLYNPYILGLIPHVLGLNYDPITAPSFVLSETSEDAPEREMLRANGVSDLDGVAIVEAFEGTRTGLAFAVRSDTGKPDLAIIEWQIACLLFQTADGKLLDRRLAHRGYPLPATMSASVMAMHEPSEEDFRTRPEHWQPNSLRFHFRGSPGFDRMARSLIVQPWVWGDPDGLETIEGAGQNALETYPLSCPAHTVAGVIESNLRYAEDLGGPDSRIDRLLVADIRRIRDQVADFRQAGDARRQAARDALFAEWKAVTEVNRSEHK